MTRKGSLPRKGSTPRKGSPDPDLDPDWQKVKKTVKPLFDAKRKAESQPKAQPFPRSEALNRPSPADRPWPRSHFMRDLDSVQKPNRPRADQPPVIRRDKKTRRGRIEIDAKLDLHDLTRLEAYKVLTLRLSRASKRGQKTLLVITGKGVRGEGVLRRAFEGWMRDENLRPFIHSYAQAHQRHGGAGAWYIFLR